MIIPETDFLICSIRLFFVSVSLLISIRIMSKYFLAKDKLFLYAGLAWVGMFESWMPSTVGFIAAFFLPNSLPLEVLVIIGNWFLPVGLFMWILLFTKLVIEKHKKIIIYCTAAFGVIFETVFFVLLFTDSKSVYKQGPPPEYVSTPFNIYYALLFQLFQLVFLIIFIITGILFARKSMQSSNDEVNLKGKLLLAAFLLYLIGALIAILESSALIILISSFFLTSSSIAFYGGYILPNWMKKILRK